MNKSNFFDAYYNNAEVNSIIIMTSTGTILEVNRAFTNNFGYTSKDLEGKHFRKLFNASDKILKTPDYELETVIKKGQADDEGIIVDNNGHEIWCSGESLLVNSADGEKYIVKDVINLQAKKQINLFLRSTEELLERIFNASKDIPMMILDGSMKIKNLNKAFLEFFEIEKMPDLNNGLSSLQHTFWSNPEVRNELSKVIVTNQPIKGKTFLYETKAGEQKTILLDSKIIYGQPGTSRKIFIIIEELITADSSN